jgi:hypothetical protein
VITYSIKHDDRGFAVLVTKDGSPNSHIAITFRPTSEPSTGLPFGRSLTAAAILLTGP